MQLSGRSLFPYLFGDDFLPSYMAGTFVREGHPECLTDYGAAQRFQAHLRRVEGLEMHGRTGPWLNPPFYALPFVPLSAMPYRAALWTWFGLNLAMASGAIALLYRLLPADRRNWRDGGVLGILLLFSLPGLQVMASQQNTFLSLLLLTATTTLWRKGRAIEAGLIAGLLSFKPQLALILWGAMAISLGWRALAGVGGTVGALGISTLLLLPGTLADYASKLPRILPYLRTDTSYAWERQVTFTGFWRLLLQGRTGGPAEPGVTPIVLTCIGVVGLVLAWQIIRRSRWRILLSADPAPIIGATVASMPLLMPYFMDYDLLLLAVPATLFAAERLRAKSQMLPIHRAGFVLACVIFAWLYFNATFAAETRVSVTVILLTIQSAVLMAKISLAREDLDHSASPPMPTDLNTTEHFCPMSVAA